LGGDRQRFADRLGLWWYGSNDATDYRRGQPKSRNACGEPRADQRANHGRDRRARDGNRRGDSRRYTGQYGRVNHRAAAYDRAQLEDRPG
jgi:hypothetical protein